MHKDNYYMKQAVELAKSGIGRTASNPSVGCVIVKDDIIISSARTQNGGRPHAEYIAIDNLKKEELIGATIYITLEPCCISSTNRMFCVEKIIQSKINRVVVGIMDSNPKINGKSIKVLQKKGIEVKTGVHKESCEEVIEGFKKRMLANIPLVTLKLATSLDGKIALNNGKSKWITNENQRLLVHKLRAKNDAILTGIGTIIADDPLLICKLQGIKYNPIRIIIDTEYKIPQQSQIIQTSNYIRTIIFTAKEVKSISNNIEIIKIKRDFDGICLKDVLNKISNLGINNLLVEAGQKLNTSLIKNNLVDKIVIFQSNKIIGGDGLNAIGNLNYSELNQCPKFKTVIINENQDYW